MMSDWTYEESIRWLDAKDIFHTRLGLERINGLLENMDLKDNRVTGHVAGTNGKGSVAVFLASILASSGYRTGLYTSPHITDVRERLATERGLIDETTFAKGMQTVKEADPDNQCTYFETLTALFFWFQKEAGLEHTVLETGMGGRLDATNTATPRVSIVTPVALEHVKQLGSTVEDISREKAAIIKEGVPAVISNMDNKVLKVMEERCQQTLSPLIRADRGVDIRLISPLEKRGSRWGQIVEIVTTLGEYGEVFIPLLGSHQRMNAVTAIRAAEVLRRQGMKMSDQQIREGITEARWSARIQLLEHPFPIVLDVTHNPHGARVLTNELMRLMTSMELDTTVIVVGMLEDKDIDGVLAELTRLRGTIICTSPKTPRAVGSKKLVSRARELGGSGLNVLDVPDVSEAVEKARFLGDLVTVTGSFYTVGEGMESMGIKPEVLRGR